MMKIAVLCFLIELFAIRVHGDEPSDNSAYKTYYLDDYPSDSKNVITVGQWGEQAVIIKPSKNGYKQGNYSLSVIPPLSTNADRYGLIGTVQKFNLKPNGTDCTDTLRLSSVRKQPNDPNLVFYEGCKEPGPNTFVVLHNILLPKLLVELQLGAEDGQHNGFEITLTSYVKCYNSPSPYQFDCKIRCISKYLVCDGRDNCGDNADESPDACANITTTTTVRPKFDVPNAYNSGPPYMEILVGILLISICIAAVFYVLRRRRIHAASAYQAQSWTNPPENQMYSDPPAPYRVVANDN